MNTKCKLFMTITLLNVLSFIVLLILGGNSIISYLWLLVPTSIEILEILWTILWCILTINKLCDNDYSKY